MTSRPPSAFLIGILAAGLTSVGSWVPSFWSDEAATLRLARLSGPEFIDFINQKDVVHALYAVLMHLWVCLFGQSEFAVRAPSAIAVGFATAAVFLVTKEIGYERSAYWAAAVFLVMPRTSFNGTEARSYAIATALIAWAAVWLVRSAQRGRWFHWAVYCSLTGAAIGLFLYSILVLPAFVLIALHMAGFAKSTLIKVLSVSGISVAFASPIAATALSQGSQIGWLRRQPINAYTVLVEPFFGAAWWLFVLAVVLVAFAVLRNHLSLPRPLVTALGAWIFIPFVVLLVGGVILGPLFTPRYLSICTPAAAIVLGLCLSSYARSVAPIFLALLIVAALPELVSMRSETGKPGGQDLRGVAETIQTNSRPGDAFLLGHDGVVSLRPRTALAAYPASFSRLVDIELDEPYYATGTYSDTLVSREALAQRLTSYDRVWVASSTDSGDSSTALLEDLGFSKVEIWSSETSVISVWSAPP